MRLRDGLRIQRGDIVSFIGAGGKTSALFRLADELRADGWRVLATTTTRMALDEASRAPLAVRLDAGIGAAQIREWLNRYGMVFLYSGRDGPAKVVGLHPETISSLIDSVDSDVLLIEADGARRLPLKAPYDHEPVIIRDTSLVVPVAGIDVLGQPLDDSHVYNAARILARYGFPEGEPIIPPWMALAIRDPELGLRGVPDASRVVVLLNKVPPGGYARWRARRVAQLVLRSPRVEAVALGAMQDVDPVHEVQQRVAAVVLAAGFSSRMGAQSKILLPWDGRTVIEMVVSRLLAARVPEIVVVTGHRAAAVTEVLAHLPVKVVVNPEFAQGEMLSSVQTGIRSLSPDIAACLIVMGDQPTLEGRVIGRLLDAYATTGGEMLVPVFQGQRGHPVLFGKRFWPELLALETGAPRDVLRRYPDRVVQVDVNTDSILRDIDTPEQYRSERRRAGLD